MAQYTIVTNRENEAALNWQYDNYVNHDVYPTKDVYLQNMVAQTLLRPWFATFQRDHTVALDASVKTIPDANQPKAQQEIEAVIIANGGEIVTAAPPPPITAPPTALFTGRFAKPEDTAP